MARSKGFSIIELLTALGLLALISLATMSLMDFGNIGMKDIRTQAEWVDLKADIETFISVPANCKSMLAAWPAIPDSGVGPINIPTITTPTGTVIATAGGAKDTLTVSTISITDFAATSSPTLTMGRLQLTGTKKGVAGSVMGSKGLRASIPLSFIVKDVGVAGSKQFVSCVLGPNFSVTPINCPVGKVVTGFDANGDAICSTSSPSFTCANGQFLVGVASDATGAPIAQCANAASAFLGQSCPAAKVMAGFDGAGNIVCVDQASVPAGYGISPQWDSNWTGNNFTCPAGFTLTFQHYDCHCSNNATWPTCIKN